MTSQYLLPMTSATGDPPEELGREKFLKRRPDAVSLLFFLEEAMKIG